MTIALPDFIAELTQNPALFITVLLTLGVILVNGWTDAPNAIATCVSTRSMGVRPAIIMAAVFNFLGVLVMTAINKSVAETIYNMVDFGGNTADALAATPKMPWSPSAPPCSPLWSGPPWPGGSVSPPAKAML